MLILLSFLFCLVYNNHSTYFQSPTYVYTYACTSTQGMQLHPYPHVSTSMLIPRGMYSPTIKEILNLFQIITYYLTLKI